MIEMRKINRTIPQYHIKGKKEVKADLETAHRTKLMPLSIIMFDNQ